MIVQDDLMKVITLCMYVLVAVASFSSCIAVLVTFVSADLGVLGGLGQFGCMWKEDRR
jgi:hypothetical protein